VRFGIVRTRFAWPDYGADFELLEAPDRAVDPPYRSFSTLAERDESPTPHSEAIRRIITERRVTRVVHFTRLENLASIAADGALHPRSWLEETGRRFTPTDSHRHDGRSSVNLSIEFPNYQMFFSKRKSYDLDERHWAVLVFEPRLLWEVPCAFSPINAASRSISNQRREALMTESALLALFGPEATTSGGRRIQRDELQIPSSYCTHPQAEVLAQRPIELTYLRSVAVSDAMVATHPDFPDSLRPQVTVVTELFGPRKDYAIWRREPQAEPAFPCVGSRSSDDDIPF
jgi:hypothetical protein